MLDDFQRGLHRRSLKHLAKRQGSHTPFDLTGIFDPFKTTAPPVNPIITPAQPTTGLTTSTTPLPTIPPTTITPSSTISTSSASTPPASSSTSSILATTTSTSTSTSTSTTTTSSTTSSTPTPITTPPAVSRHPLTDVTTNVEVTVTTHTPQTISHSATSLAASPTSSTSASSSISTGVIVGGIIAALIGVLGIVFTIVYFVRRSRRNHDEDDSNEFDADAFRRQSTILPDDSVTGIVRAMNYNRAGARPPTMIERKMASTPVYNPPQVLSHQYEINAPYHQPSLSPGQIYSPYTPTVNSANPFFSPYGESPLGSPVSVAPYESTYDAHGRLISRQPSNASTAVLSRQTSNASTAVLSRQTSNASTAVLSRQTSVASRTISDSASQYVDMNRSSVTPFQAAQYAEISRRLNTTPPQPLPLSAVTEELENTHELPEPVLKDIQPLELKPTISVDEGQHLNIQPTPCENSFPDSPFADPNMAGEHTSRRNSTDSTLMPPEPSFAAKPRITSTPPTLPEIHIHQRSFSPVTLDFPLAPSFVPPLPSPFASSIPSPPPNAHFPEEPTKQPESALATAPSAFRSQMSAPAAKRPDTVYTLYDDDDAYGGI